MSSVELTPCNVGLKTQIIKIHFYHCNYDVAVYSFNRKKNQFRGNIVHAFHVLLKQKIQVSYSINWSLYDLVCDTAL